MPATLPTQDTGKWRVDKRKMRETFAKLFVSQGTLKYMYSICTYICTVVPGIEVDFNIDVFLIFVCVYTI
jgi:hypothetical protein